jgi:hypothetical protein
MARTVLAAETINTEGVEPTVEQGTADGHAFPNNGRTIIRLTNTGAGAHEITFQTTGNLDGLAVADRIIEVPPGEVREVGPFAATVYGSTVLIDFDDEPGEVEVECKTFSAR